VLLRPEDLFGVSVDEVFLIVQVGDVDVLQQTVLVRKEAIVDDADGVLLVP
jgi:hypothetical protein